MNTSISTYSTATAANHGQVLDGSDIMNLVGNDKVFSTFVDHKFSQLDKDRDGHLSVTELRPAVADIGAALGLPAQGSSSVSDLIYSEVLNEFTHGRQGKVNKTVFKEVLSDILLGMAAGLKRDPVVILRIDGEDLLEFINGPGYEPEMVSIFSELGSADDVSLHVYIVKAFQKLTVGHGLPPASDSWVISNLLEPSLQSIAGQYNNIPVSQEKFLDAFKQVSECVAQHLKEQPVIVAHSENTFDGSGIRRLLSNKFELDKMLNSTLENLKRDRSRKISKEYLSMVLDSVAPSAGLPPIGAIEEMDQVMNEAFKMVDADDRKQEVKEDEFRKMVVEILGSIMLQLEGNPISISSNSIVHEPLESASTLLQTSS